MRLAETLACRYRAQRFVVVLNEYTHTQLHTRTVVQRTYVSHAQTNLRTYRPYIIIWSPRYQVKSILGHILRDRKSFSEALEPTSSNVCASTQHIFPSSYVCDCFFGAGVQFAMAASCRHTHTCVFGVFFFTHRDVST